MSILTLTLSYRELKLYTIGLTYSLCSLTLPHGNQFSKIINSEMVILTPITINNHFNNANYVTKVDHLCSERHTFNFLLKKVDFRDLTLLGIDNYIQEKKNQPRS